MIISTILAKLFISQGIKETIKDKIGIGNETYYYQYDPNFKHEPNYFELKKMRYIRNLFNDFCFNIRTIAFNSGDVRLTNKLNAKNKKIFEKATKFADKWSDKNTEYYEGTDLARFEIMTQLYEKKGIFNELIKIRDFNEYYSFLEKQVDLVMDEIDAKMMGNSQQNELQENIKNLDVTKKTLDLETLEQQKALIEAEIAALKKQEALDKEIAKKHAQEYTDSLINEAQFEKQIAAMKKVEK